MTLKRKGEDGHPPFRSERIFSVGNEWFFSTREGEDVGPFESKEEASAALTLFLREMATNNQKIRGD